MISSGASGLLDRPDGGERGVSAFRAGALAANADTLVAAMDQAMTEMAGR